MHYCPHTSKWCKNDTACVAVGECLQASGVKFANEKPPPPAAPTLEQLAKDSARYRWLKEQHEKPCPGWHVRSGFEDLPVDLDAEIDAAMLKNKPSLDT